MKISYSIVKPGCVWKKYNICVDVNVEVSRSELRWLILLENEWRKEKHQEVGDDHMNVLKKVEMSEIGVR